LDRIIVAFSAEEARRRVARLLETEGLSPAALCATGAEVLRTVRKLGSAIVICGFKMRDATATELAADLLGTALVLAVTSPAHLDFCEGENLFRLASPVSRADFFAQLGFLLRTEENTLHPPAVRRLADEKLLVTQAKALLMEIGRMSESEAHRYLQKRSMDTGARLCETAQAVIDSFQTI